MGVVILGASLCLAFACGGAADDSEPATDPSPGPDPDPNPDPNPALPPGSGFYAHSDKQLYLIQEGGNVAAMAAFGGDFDLLRDIAIEMAVNAQGEIYVLTSTKLFRVDPSTSSATLVTPVSILGVSGLAFLPQNPAAPDGPERLVAAQGNQLSEISLVSGAVVSLGSLGGGYWFDGDIFYRRDEGLFGVIRSESVDTSVANISLAGWTPTLIGGAGVSDVRALALLGDSIYGATRLGEVFAMDPATGGVQTVREAGGGVSIWGSGVAPTPP